MRVNVYAEEMTDRVEIIAKEIDGQTFTGLRIYLELPATVDGKQYQAPFMHRPGDDDSSAVTFWGKKDLREVLGMALRALDSHYDKCNTHSFARLYHGADVERCSKCLTLRRATGISYEHMAPDSQKWTEDNNFCTKKEI